MTEVGTESRILRAVVFALTVLAQLMLPAIVLRAEAIAGDLCVAQSGGADAQKSGPHAHGEHCTQCQLPAGSTLRPPDLRIVEPALRAAGPASLPEIAARPALLRRAQPPPTGPPVS